MTKTPASPRPAPIRLSKDAARRFALEALGLRRPFASIAAALAHLGYVQIDPINICGRMHDLILRNRIPNYREGDLIRHVHGGAEDESPVPPPGIQPPARKSPPTGSGAHGRSAPRPAAERIAFEHHHPETQILAAFPLEAWPHLLAAMRARARRTSAWSGRLTPRERDLVPQLLAEIAARGPLGSDDFDDARRAHRSVWGASTLVKSTLQKLFFHGRLLIAARSQHRRRYDLPERVLPPAILALPEPSAAETRRWLARLKLRQRRLAVLKRDELREVAGLVTPVAVDGCPLLHCLNEDLPRLERCRDGSDAPETGPESDAPPAVRLLAPLDPLIYDRRVTRTLWDFDYTWEAYTPAARRVRGHYALPVLAGTALVGHVEPKADRAARRLVVASRSVHRGYTTAPAVGELARWLGLRAP